MLHFICLSDSSIAKIEGDSLKTLSVFTIQIDGDQTENMKPKAALGKSSINTVWIESYNLVDAKTVNKTRDNYLVKPLSASFNPCLSNSTLKLNKKQQLCFVFISACKIFV